MNFNSLLADVVSRINMGNRHRVKTVILFVNKLTMEIIYVLLDLGLIRGFKLISHNKITLNLRFYKGTHIFYKLNLVSKPSKKIFWNLHRLRIEIDRNNSIIFIVSTKDGLLIGSECLWRSLSGQILLKILL